MSLVFVVIWVFPNKAVSKPLPSTVTGVDLHQQLGLDEPDRLLPLRLGKAARRALNADTLDLSVVGGTIPARLPMLLTNQGRASGVGPASSVGLRAGPTWRSQWSGAPLGDNFERTACKCCVPNPPMIGLAFLWGIPEPGYPP